MKKLLLIALFVAPVAQLSAIKTLKSSKDTTKKMDEKTKKATPQKK